MLAEVDAAIRALYGMAAASRAAKQKQDAAAELRDMCRLGARVSYDREADAKVLEILNLAAFARACDPPLV